MLDSYPAMNRRLVGALSIVFGWCLGEARSQCETVWLPGPGRAGTDGVVFASTMWDPDGAGPQPAKLVIGGGFATAGNIVANRVAVLDPGVWSGWSALGSGMNGSVSALTTWNGSLVAAGSFTTADGTPANCIARWTGTAWEPLGSGVCCGGFSTFINTLAVLPSGELVAGGDFTIAGGVPVRSLARWDGSTWAPIGPFAISFGDIVYGSAVLPNGNLVIAGSFASVGGVAANNVALWDGATWSALGAGVNSTAMAVAAMPNGNVVVGGFFSTAGGSSSNARLALWDGTAWSSLGLPAPGASSILALHVTSAGSLVVGGDFTSVGGVPAAGIARWQNGTWSPLGSGVPAGYVRTLTGLPNGSIAVGGGFSTAGGVFASNLAIWNSTAWSPVGLGPNAEVRALAALPNGHFVAGGNFTQAGAGAANHVAIGSGGTWAPLGPGVDGSVHALAVMPNGSIVAGGDFAAAGTLAVQRIARWDGVQWSALGAGCSFTVSALRELDNGDLLAGGYFTQAGGLTANGFARWDGASWSVFGAGPGIGVRAIALLADGSIVVGGAPNGPTFEPKVKRWDGTAWVPLGSVSGTVNALTLRPNGDLVAGGLNLFPGSHVLTWSGTQWLPLGAGVDGTVHALRTLPDGDVLATGDFTSAGGAPASRIARWNGSSWAPVGPGLAGGASTVRGLALAQLAGGDVLVGGSFTSAGGQGSTLVARLTPQCPAAASAYGVGCVGSAGPMTLASVALPFVGGTFRGTANGLPATSFAIELFGFAPLATPLNLIPQGVTGCSLLASPDVWLADLPAAGVASTQLGIPDSLALVGAQLFHQVVAIELDAASAIIAITSSNGLELTIGAF